MLLLLDVNHWYFVLSHFFFPNEHLVEFEEKNQKNLKSLFPCKITYPTCPPIKYNFFIDFINFSSRFFHIYLFYNPLLIFQTDKYIINSLAAVCAHVKFTERDQYNERAKKKDEEESRSVLDAELGAAYLFQHFFRVLFLFVFYPLFLVFHSMSSELVACSTCCIYQLFFQYLFLKIFTIRCRIKFLLSVIQIRSADIPEKIHKESQIIYIIFYYDTLNNFKRNFFKSGLPLIIVCNFSFILFPIIFKTNHINIRIFSLLHFFHIYLMKNDLFFRENNGVQSSKKESKRLSPRRDAFSCKVAFVSLNSYTFHISKPKSLENYGCNNSIFTGYIEILLLNLFTFVMYLVIILVWQLEQ
uniref:Uncharacterized protein n=1 Tax=Heterorhabditis bacteriophora TaxID=37862 RepID=A0A1I7WIG0_HETBA